MSEADATDAEEMAQLRAENAAMRAERAELLRKIDGLEGTVDGMRFVLRNAKLLPPSRAEGDAHLRSAPPQGSA